MNFQRTQDKMEVPKSGKAGYSRSDYEIGKWWENT
jgi:hypothetical protein